MSSGKSNLEPVNTSFVELVITVGIWPGGTFRTSTLV